MLTRCRRRLAITVLTACTIALTAGSARAGEDEYQGPNYFQIAADLIVYRPLSLVQTAIGAGMFVPIAPFAYIDGRLDEAYDLCVREPFEYTFTRPLGEP